MCILQPSCLPASPPNLRWTVRTHAFTANDRGRVRTITLRFFPAAIFRNSTGSACINRSSQELQTVFQQEHAAYELSCTNLHQPLRNGRSPGRSAAALALSAAALALASAGAGVPERRVKQFQIHMFIRRASVHRGLPLASPITRCFSTKITYSGATCVFSRGQQLH